MAEPGLLSELQSLREQLQKSEAERKSTETQLSEANSAVTKLQEEGSCQQRKHCSEVFLSAVAAEKRVKGHDGSMACHEMKAPQLTSGYQ